MYFKFLLVFFSAVMLAACGKPDTDLGDVQPAVAPKASSTAIFLPGGGGIDFAMLPVADSSGKNSKDVPFKSLYYDFSGKQPEEIDKAIDKVLLNQGYSKKEEALHGSLIKNYLYRKEGSNPIAVQYSEHFKEGFQHTVRVLFWWYEQ
ncbi:hypothetical protein [Thiopseudomonas alkaliphila]|uniref:hypothetical protein n=1 Tax=Thiopseudomonas alkaliphila TaxID=1697053 RepID=UPI00069F8AB9|nr:hypothetical protein [Thiopseudomonas alkaliphila]AKX54007.1 hypothetical protein AKN91_10295 [Thiopseudomonas alkaliphila]